MLIVFGANTLEAAKNQLEAAVRQAQAAELITA
jgi:hypothetical protein